jgi:hypothetical protein
MNAEFGMVALEIMDTEYLVFRQSTIWHIDLPILLMWEQFQSECAFAINAIIGNA